MVNWVNFLLILDKLIENSLIRKISLDLYEFLSKKVNAVKFTSELNAAINKNQINDFIEKYQISSERATQIRNVTRLRHKIVIIERIIEKKFYDEKSINIISNLINELQELKPLSDFKDSKIKFKIKNIETNNIIKTDNENYIFAVLKRFIATVYTHLIWKGLGEKGILLNFDFEIDPLYSRFRSDNFSTLTLDIAINNLYDIFNEWCKISNLYQKAINCLIESKEFILRLPKNFDISKNISSDHLLGLADGLEAENQFWFYKLSGKVKIYTEVIFHETKNDSKKLLKILNKEKIGSEDAAKFLKYLDYYMKEDEGISGVRELLNRSIRRLNPGNEKTQFQKRKEDLPSTKAKPIIFAHFR